MATLTSSLDNLLHCVGSGSATTLLDSDIFVYVYVYVCVYVEKRV